ncbi:MAG TPA: PAS domain S-box protein [Chthoniobacterales bacterium]|jgi:two-component system CheB/CheR fusion protein
MPEIETNNMPPAAALDPAATDDSSENGRDGAKQRRDPNHPAAIIGFGASAGGLAPLQQFFADMKPDSGLAFVVVMHLSPDFESQLANVLQQKTSMKVVQVNESIRVQPNKVYVIPPNHQLTFEDSTLHLQAPQHLEGRRVTIDLFFRTLAQAYGQRAVCVILSGTDSDGVIGLKHIRAQGGLTIAQDPSEAEFDSMPANAIGTGMVDWVLPVSQMPAKLMEFVRNEHAMQLPPEIPEAEDADAKVADAPGGETVSDVTRDSDDEDAIQKVLAHVRAQTGHDFAHYKRATILRRIARRLQVNSIEDIPSYLAFLYTHPGEARALLHDLLIGVTHFFRDQAAFGVLEANIPQLFAGKRSGDQIRVWVPGCATGEEAYSIAIMLAEQAVRTNRPPAIQIFATDLDEDSIKTAREGIYPATIEADVSQERLRQFFFNHQGRYRIRKEVRELVLFAEHDLLRDSPFSRLDLISCRNLLIYLKPDAQRRVMDIFHFALRASGLLLLGGSEHVEDNHALFHTLDSRHRLYVRRSTPRMPIVNLYARPPQLRRPLPDPGLPRLATPALEADFTPGGEEEGPMTLAERRGRSLAGLHRALLEQYGPPSLVVDANHDIVHMSRKAGDFLHFGAGEPSANVLKLVDETLRVELRTALFRADQEETNVFVPRVHTMRDGERRFVDLHVRPAPTEDSAEKIFLVIFDEKAATAGDQDESIPVREEGDKVAQHLENEVKHLRQQLAVTIEQTEASQEELKASNEELQAMNEEMRSATEELETGKEELQSVNEELTTVNHELKASVEELSRINSDLNNLMASTDIGTIFLDRQLRIHRFTPSAQKVFNLIPADLGRPISDITTRLHYDGFVEDMEKVLRDLVTLEREVRVGEEENWYLTRIAPYRSGEDRIAGLVATFIDITRRKKAEEDLRESEERLRRAVENETVGVLFFTTDGRITYSNNAFLKMSGYTPEDLARGLLRLDAMTPPEFISQSRDALEELKLTGKSTTHEKQYIRKDGSRWWGLFSVSRLTDDLNVKFILDITDRKNTEEALRTSEERVRAVADHVPQLIWTNDADGKANYFNRRWHEYTGLSDEQSAGAGGRAIVHPADEPSSTERWQQALARGAAYECELRLRGRDGEYRWFIIRNIPLRDDAGEVRSWFGSATDINDLKRTQVQLSETDQRFQLLIEGTPDYAMFLMDPNNIITYWSIGAEKVFGWTAEEAVGQSGELIFTPEDRADKVEEKEIDIALRDGRAPDRRWHLRKDGSQIWVDGVMRRIDRGDGSLRGFAKIARDATDQHRAEEELTYARDQLEQRVLERTADLMATNNELERTMLQREQLERELLEISERERRRIGQDLHDIVCQELTATALYLKSAGNKADNSDAAKTLDEAAEIVNRNVAIARDLARGFQPTVLGTGGLPAALRTLCKDANDRNGLHCTLKLPRAIRVRDETIALNLFRIAQEAMRNAITHSNGDEIILCIERENDFIRLVIEDNGKGFRPRKASKGLGLHIMKYRSNVLGGILTIEPRRNGGTKVVCEVPIKK